MTEETEYFKFLDHLQKIWNLKDECRTLSKCEIYTANDVRNTFYSQIMNVINDYYLGMAGPILINRLDKPFRDGVLIPYFPISEENEHVSNLGFLKDNQYLKTWHDMKKLGLVFTIWIVFEDTIDIIYKSIVTESEIKTNQNGNYNRIKKIVEGKLNEEEIQNIQNKLKSDYIGINNKYNYILKELTLDRIQSKQLQDIREFLQFFNILRNTLHTNSRPMKDYQFKLEIGNIKFEKDKHIDFFTFDVLYYSIRKFVDIFSFIRDNLKVKEEIFNPTTTINGSY